MISNKTKAIVVGLALLIVGLLLLDRMQAPKVSLNTSEAAGLGVLTQNDLQFAGGFLIPDECGFAINGITVRYENGIRHFLTRAGHGCGTYQNYLFDYLDPGQPAYRTTYPYNLAVHPAWGGNWGVVGTAWSLPNLTPGANTVPCNQCAGIGLYWDELGQKLYSNFANLYTFNTPDPSVTQSVLNNTTHTGSDVGCFGFQTQAPNATSHGVAALPPWFISAYLPAGERLAAGFGGPWESVNGAAYSHGPSLVSFLPPTNLNGCPTTTANWIQHHLALLYPYNSMTSVWPTGAPTPARMLGFGFVRDDYGGWSSYNGHGFVLNSDGISQGCVPVWSDVVQGFFCLIEKSDGKLDATILGSPAPTLNSARISNVRLADGSFLQKGDGIELQIGPLGGQNCNGTSMDILVDAVNTSTGDITWTLSSYGPVTAVPPLVGGFVKGSAGHYCHAYPGPMRVTDVFQVYDMNDLGKVIQGAIASNAPNPTAEWIPSFPSATRPNPRCGANGAGACANDSGSVGVAYDPVANQIIVGIRNIDSVGWAQHNPAIFVFNVRTSAGFPTLPPPGPGPSPTPTPTPGPSPSPSPTPTPTPTVESPDCTKATSIKNSTGNLFTIDFGWTLIDGAYSLQPSSLGGASGDIYKYVNKVVYVHDARSATLGWYRWDPTNSSKWIMVNSEPACGTSTTLVGDLNGDKIVNSLDWSIMNGKWFTNNAAADLNHDGLVNSIDFSLLNANWFKTIP